MSKNEITKAKLTVSIEKSTSDEINQYCNDNFINKSRLVDNIIKRFLKEEKK